MYSRGNIDLIVLFVLTMTIDISQVIPLSVADPGGAVTGVLFSEDVQGGGVLVNVRRVDDVTRGMSKGGCL